MRWPNNGMQRPALRAAADAERWAATRERAYGTEGTVLTNRYMTSTKNLAAIMQKIIDGTAPPKFTVAHLKGIGFKSSNDQGIIPILKDLGFLTSDGTPTPRYHEYRDKSRSRTVLGQAIREAYEDIFHIKESPTKGDRAAIEGRFKSVHNASDVVAARQAATFLALLDLADLSGAVPPKPKKEDKHAPGEHKDEDTKKHTPSFPPAPSLAGLRYNIEIHLPATKDTEVYNAIFKSLKEHLLED